MSRSLDAPLPGRCPTFHVRPSLSPGRFSVPWIWVCACSSWRSRRRGRGRRAGLARRGRLLTLLLGAGSFAAGSADASRVPSSRFFCVDVWVPPRFAPEPAGRPQEVVFQPRASFSVTRPHLAFRSLIVASAGHVSSFRKSTRALQGELSEAASARAFSPRPRVSVLPRTPAPRGFPLGTLRLSPHAVPSAGTAGTAEHRAEAEPENSQHEAGAPTHSEGVGGPGDRAAGARGAAPSAEGDPGTPRPAPATALPRQWEGAAWSQPPQVSPRAVQSVKTLGGPRPVIRGDSELEEPREPASSMCGHVRGAHLHPKP